jgi:hypothetical protein
LWGDTVTQRDRVLGMLLEADEVCGSTFYADHIPRFSVQIHLLRRAGYLISKRPCDIEQHHHENTGWLYRLEAIPALEAPAESVPEVDGQLALPISTGDAR